ncbi:tRNA (5-methylaminomethyl-2-thiouridine)(34)-methyltransferase MnmD [Thermovibrio sp.]
MVKEVKTEDGSLTLFSEEFKEPYHSITAGAITESVEKFIEPTRLKIKAKEGKVNLLDSCFGLGYNTLTAVRETLKENPRAQIEVVGFEKDLRVIEKSLKILPRELRAYSFILKELLKNKNCHRDILTLNFASCRVKVKVFIGEGREILREISRYYRGFADAIFHDPFSPKVNPELWTYEFFLLLRKTVKEDGILATYSSSTPIRRALYMAGFGVKEGVAVGRKSRSTVASPSFKTDPVLLKKFSLPSAVPFRDPKLKDPRELIKNRQRWCVKALRRTYRPIPIYHI